MNGGESGPGRGRVAWLGLGSMGTPMAQRLLTPEFELSVFDVSAERARAFDGTAATVAQSAKAAVSGAGTVGVMVATAEQLEIALFGPEGGASGLAPGATVLLMSTVGPEAARALERRLADRGVSVIDAPVSGGVKRAASGDLLIMASGPSEVLESVRPVLNRLGSRVANVGDEAGSGQALKLVNQLLCGVHIGAAAEALNLATALGLDATKSWEAVRTGAAASFMLDDRGQRMLSREFTPSRSALNIFVKDMGLVLKAARDSRTPTPIAGAAEQLYLAAASAGLGDLDDSSLISLFDRTPQSADGR